ncbi:hypothetical protein D3C87_1749750 [compost metagenome]
MIVSRPIEPEVIIAHAIFNPLLLNSIILIALFYAINLTCQFVSLPAQLIS